MAQPNLPVHVENVNWHFNWTEVEEKSVKMSGFLSFQIFPFRTQQFSEMLNLQFLLDTTCHTHNNRIVHDEQPVSRKDRKHTEILKQSLLKQYALVVKYLRRRSSEHGRLSCVIETDTSPPEQMKGKNNKLISR